MKKLLFLAISPLSFVFCQSSLNAQTIPPPYINYQAVLYDVNGTNPNNPLINQSFSTFVNINDELGNLLYSEEHYASTDANGLITVKMGDGLYTAGPITNFNQINWGVGKYYLVVDFNINGTISSTAPEQLVTVPYSFYAGNAGNGMTAVADNGNGTLTFTYSNGQTYITPALSGIQGAVGPQGPTGAQGPAGTNGLNALIKTTTEPAGANCTNGGTKIETGLDANSNGVLDAGEVNPGQTKYVCNGINGTQGSSSSNQTVSINGVSTTQYLPGYLFDTGNCADGSLSTTGNYTLNSTFAQYCNLKINAGHTFNIPVQPASGDNLITTTILVKDTLFLNGIINGTPVGTHNPYIITDINTAGGPGGSSSSANSSSTSGASSIIEWNSYNQSSNITPPIYSTILTGGFGCTTITPPLNMAVTSLKEAIKIKSQLGGVAGQGSNPNGYGLTPYNNGGYGGTGLYIICRVLVFNGQINLKGSNGSASYSNWGANVYGGGGGGGSLVISAESIIQNTGTINLNGGTGSLVSTFCKSSGGGNGAYLIIDR